jgi:formamidopyrimidine-DNA glycosylase
VPELPDVTLYVEALTARVVGHPMTSVTLQSPFVLRSVTPPVDALNGKTLRAVRRIGKRIALGFDDELFLVIHLMIAGRLRWREPGKKLGFGGKMLLASFAFSHGTLFLTEASSKKRASIEVVRGEDALRQRNPGGVEPLESTLEQFASALAKENHTLKRALTDPHLFSGIGNAYSDEILHAAKLSPLKLTRSMNDEEIGRLYDATRATLVVWIDLLRRELVNGFPEKVTAFREAMAVHGRFKQPCPVCSAPVQRIVYAENECNYCPRCQTGGRVLADRSLSRLLKDDWPREIS